MKLFRDLWLARGRVVLMVIAIAVSIFGIGTVLSAYAIMTREISRNYLSTNPASATIELDMVDDAVVAAARQRPGITDAQARTSVLARAQIGQDEWRPLLLFVVQDFDAMRISTFSAVEGAWPPPTGAMLVERSALEMLQTRTGAAVIVKTPHGARQEVPVVGLVHDPGLAPAWQERMGYGYITPATLAWLGEGDRLDELKITVDAPSFDAATIERATRDLAAWLQTQGRTVEEIQIPPPGRHPHQTQMMALLLLLLIFSLMALGLSAILVATMINGLLAQQIRQIGVMKTIGAQSGQIAVLYLALVLLISSAALIPALPAGVAAGRAFAGVAANLLNLTLFSIDIPWWVFAAQAAAGLLIPLLVAASPIMRGSRITVREAISDYGVRQENFGRGIDALFSAVRGLDRALLLALRNTFRRRGRLLLTLGLLMAGGAMFMTGLNVSSAWQRNIADGLANRHYDLEIRLNRPEEAAPLVARIGAVPGVRTVEVWGYAPTGLAQPGVLDIVRTYPDGGHGSFTLRAPPATTALVQFPLLAGRWLQPGDTDAVVLNHMTLAQLPDVSVGDTIALAVDGKPTKWRVVGIVREIGSPAAAYVTDEALASVTNQQGLARSLRIVTSASDPASRGEVIRAVERALDQAGVSVSLLITDSELRTAMGDHIAILITALIFMAVLMAVVGGIGLTATMSTNVVERTREFGILQTIGGTSGTVLRIVVSEGVFIGALSWVGAFVLALPLSALVGVIVGNLAFRTPLPLVVSPLAVALWLAIVIVGSAAASAYPAWRASRLTIRETLAYV